MCFVDLLFAAGPFLRGAVVLTVALVVTRPGFGRSVSEQPGTERDALAVVRVALGGDAALQAIKSLWLVGSTATGFNGVTGRLMPAHPAEIRLLFPNGYLRVDYGPAADARSGVAGSLLLNAWTPRGPGTAGSVRYGPDAAAAEQREFARLALGLVARTDTVGSLRARSVKVRGQGRSVELVDGDGLALRLETDPNSGLPTRVVYATKVQFPKPLTSEERRTGIPPPEPLKDAEVTLSFEGHVRVNGVMLPTRIQRISNGVMLENFSIDRVVVNAFASTAEMQRR